MSGACHLQARLDLYFRLRGEDADAEVPGVSFSSEGASTPLSSTWMRNRPGEADTLEVEIAFDALPIDPRALRGAAVDHWLFEGRQPSRCEKGDPGHFGGIVDTVARKGNRLVLSCRDHTAVPLATKIPEAALAGFSLVNSPPLEVVVRSLLDLLPGGSLWRIEALTPIDRIRVVGPPIVVPARPVRGETKAQAKKRLAAIAKGPSLAQFMPPGGVTVWAAVHDVCIRHGITPEVREDRDGRVVTLVATQDLQTSTVLRPFVGRDGASVRLFREVECTSFDEEMELTASEKLPDFIEVASIDPTTGARVSARWPEADLGDGADKRSNGDFQTIDGITSQAELQRIARDAFEARAHNQHRVSITVPMPWSADGGPERPDLLDLAYGAGAVIERRPRSRVYDALMRRPGFPASTALRLQRAHDRIGEFGLLYQVVDVTHKLDNAPSYSCTVNARHFLGLGRFEVTELGPVNLHKFLPENRGGLL